MAIGCLSAVRAIECGYSNTPRLRLVQDSPRIVDAARKLKARSFMISTEAVWCGTDGVSDFDKLHSQAYNDCAFLYGFDLLLLDGEDSACANSPLEKRRKKLQ